jgi:hypothetical protein
VFAPSRLRLPSAAASGTPAPETLCPNNKAPKNVVRIWYAWLGQKNKSLERKCILASLVCGGNAAAISAKAKYFATFSRPAAQQLLSQFEGG